MLKRVMICMGALLASACTTAMYNGPRLPPSELAVLASDDSAISEIDYVKAPYSGGNFGKYEVLPGEHAVGVRLNKSMATFRYYSHALYRVCLDAEAGKTYRVKIEMRGSLWRPYVIDESSGRSVGYTCSSSTLDMFVQ